MTSDNRKLRPTFYCARCGKELKSTKVDIGFDIETGKVVFNLIYECRSRRWFWDGHTKFKSDMYGGTYAFSS